MSLPLSRLPPPCDLPRPSERPGSAPSHREARRSSPAGGALALIGLLLACSRPPPTTEERQPGGVVVVDVAPVSPRLVVELAPGDLVRSWQPPPPSAAEGQGDEAPRLAGLMPPAIESPFDLWRLQRIVSPRGAVVLAGERAGEAREWRLPAAPWGVTARPILDVSAADLYDEARRAAQEERFADAAALLERAAERTVDLVGRAWLDAERASLLSEARLWEPSDALYDALLNRPVLRQRPQAAIHILLAWAESLRSRQEWRLADEKLEQALRLEEESSSQAASRNGLLRAQVLLRRGALATVREDRATAQEHFAGALALAQRLAPDSYLTAELLGLQGSTLSRRGEVERGGELLDRALDLIRRTLPGSMQEADMLLRLGFIAFQHGDLDRLEETGLEARAIYEGLEQRESVARIDTNLAVASLRRGDLDRADERLRRAFEYFERYDPDSPAAANVSINWGNVARRRGELRLAEERYRRALEIIERATPGSIQAALVYGALGAVAAARGDLDTAEGYHRLGLEISERERPGSLEAAEHVSDLGALHKERGDLDRAEDLYLRALAVREELAPDGLDVSRALVNLAQVSRERGDFETAESRLLRALEIRERVAPGSFHVASTLQNLGSLEADRGRPELAEPYYRRALEMREGFSPNSLSVADSLSALAGVAAARGDLERSETLHRRALSLRQQLAPGSFREATSLHDLGATLRLQGREEEGNDFLCGAVEVLDAQMDRIGGSDEERGSFRARFAELYQDCVESLVALGRDAEAFAVAEGSRARLLLELMSQRDLELDDGLPPELTERRRQLAREYDRLQAELADPEAGGEERADLRRQLREVRAAQAEVTEEVRRASPRLAALRHPRRLDVTGARRALDPGTALLLYAVGTESTRLFVVAAAAEEPPLEVFTLAAGREELARRVSILRALIERGRESAPHVPEAAFVIQARRLFELLLAPAAAQLETADRILIAADGPLHLLPFAALVLPAEAGSDLPEAPRFVVQWRPLHHVVSAAVYEELRARRVAGGRAPPLPRLTAFGDPRYDRSRQIDAHRSLAPRPLPGTRREVEAIADLFPPHSAQTFLGRDATEARVKQHDAQPGFLHYACHAFVDDRFPLDSGLVFAAEGSGARAENGVLQAWEILEQMRIEADLVTLSACRTALGGLQPGEGLIGLTRALQVAGARSIVASLWQVEDRSTSELMTRFYSRLRDGAAKDEALRAAQRDLLEDPAAEFSHPFHWAAFQLIGDWRP